jgi:hypothetical protein
MPSPSFNREAIDAEIDPIRSLGVDELRRLWRATFRASAPPGFTKDLIARFLCWHIQEQAFGGLDPQTTKHLASLARGDKSPANCPRRLKPGTVLVREYRGERHTVTVVANGFVWREATYLSGHGARAQGVPRCRMNQKLHDTWVLAIIWTYSALTTSRQRTRSRRWYAPFGHAHTEIWTATKWDRFKESRANSLRRRPAVKALGFPFNTSRA